VLSGFCIKHRNLLETRVEITAYNLHWRLLSPESWSSSNSSLLGAGWGRRCYPIKPKAPPDQAKRLKELKKENGKLKRLMAELSLDKQILKDIAEGNSKPGATSVGGRMLMGRDFILALPGLPMFIQNPR
jgi:hypothetical protein